MHKYLLSDNKYYGGDKLKKISDILEYNRNVDVDDNVEEEKHNEQLSEKKINKKLKQVGISQENLVVEPRVRRGRQILDL